MDERHEAHVLVDERHRLVEEVLALGGVEFSLERVVRHRGADPEQHRDE